jgi:hypothetical protein
VSEDRWMKKGEPLDVVPITDYDVGAAECSDPQDPNGPKEVALVFKHKEDGRILGMSFTSHDEVVAAIAPLVRAANSAWPAPEAGKPENVGPVHEQRKGMKALRGLTKEITIGDQDMESLHMDEDGRWEVALTAVSTEAPPTLLSVYVRRPLKRPVVLFWRTADAAMDFMNRMVGAIERLWPDALEAQPPEEPKGAPDRVQGRGPIPFRRARPRRRGK